MDREHIKGATEKAKGAVKDAAGKLIGNERLQRAAKNCREPDAPVSG
jgi:uncharacterized protein YjbJ (UPF0337 family)